MCIHCNHSAENNDLQYHQDIAEEKTRLLMTFDGGASSSRNRQACSRALHVSHNVLFRNKLLRRNFHLTFSVGMKIKLVHQGGESSGVKYINER